MELHWYRNLEIALIHSEKWTFLDLFLEATSCRPILSISDEHEQ